MYKEIYRVLVVDKDDADRAMLTGLLGKSPNYQFYVTETNSAKNALALVDSNEFDCILLDELLTDLSVQDFLGKLSTKPLDVMPSILLLISRKNTNNKRKIKINKVIDTLKKDELSKETLVSAVLKAISIKEANEKRMRRKNILFYLAMYDSVTGTITRYAFLEILDAIIANRARVEYQSSLLLLDLDGFKNISDRYGVKSSDDLLAEVAKRLRSNLRKGDIIGRIGKDQFSIILPSVQSSKDAGLVATKLLELVQKPFEIDGHVIETTCSIGIVNFEDIEVNTSENLIKAADIALYQVKSNGGNGYYYFNDKNLLV